MITSSFDFKYIATFILCGVLALFSSQNTYAQNEVPPDMQEIMKSMEHLQNDPEFKSMMDQMGFGDMALDGMQMMVDSNTCLVDNLGEDGANRAMQKINTLQQEQNTDPVVDKKIQHIEDKTKQMCASGQIDAANQYYDAQMQPLYDGDAYLREMEKVLTPKEMAAMERCGQSLKMDHSPNPNICASYELEKNAAENLQKMLLQQQESYQRSLGQP